MRAKEYQVPNDEVRKLFAGDMGDMRDERAPMTHGKSAVEKGDDVRTLPSLRRQFICFVAILFLLWPTQARASLFQGETLDAVANGISWVVLVIAPIIGIAAFWLVHILPEKIAERKRHPQTRAIQCLCLLSLCFGGLLWPLAWLWAYTKPVLHKMAYGTDVDESHGHVGEEVAEEENEIGKLRARLAELEAKTGSGRS